MAFNKYTQITPSQYNPRSLQETLYLPTLKRQKHDQLLQESAKSQSLLDQLDHLDGHSDRATAIKDDLNSKMNAFTENLAKHGVSSDSRGTFLDIGKEFSQQVNKSGDLFKMDAIKTKYLTDKERIKREAVAKGHDPEQSLKNLDNYYNEYFESGKGEALEYIDLPESPEFYDVATFINEFKGTIGSESFNEIIQSGNVTYKNGIFRITDETLQTAHNLEQLKALNALAKDRLLAEGSKGRASADWNNKDLKQLENEINNAMNVMRSHSEITNKTTRVDLSMLKDSMKPSEETDTGGSYTKTYGDLSLGLESEQDFNTKFDDVKADLNKAIESGNPDKIKEATYNYRKLQNVKQEVTEKVDSKMAPLILESEDELFKQLDPSLNELNLTDPEEIQEVENAIENLLSIDGTVHINKSINPSNKSILDSKVTTRLVKDDNGEAVIRIATSTYPEGEVVTNVEKYSLPGSDYDKIINAKNLIVDLKNDRQKSLDAEYRTQKESAIGLSPKWESSAQKKLMFEETISKLNINSVKPQEIYATDKDGEKITSTSEDGDVNNDATKERLLTFLQNSKSQYDVQDMEVYRRSNKSGYRVSLNIKEDMNVEDIGWSTEIPKGGNLSFFIPLDEEDIQGMNGSSYFYNEALKGNDKEITKRGIKYGDIIPTKIEGELNSNYNISSTRFSNSYDNTENVDFLENKNGEIEFHKVKTNQPGKSQGKITVSEFYKKLENDQINDKYRNQIMQILIYNTLTEEQIKGLKEDNPNNMTPHHYLIQSDRPLRVRGKNQLEIFLAATEL